MLHMGDGTGGYGGEHDETVGDAMVDIETAMVTANKRHREGCDCGSPVFFDWLDILCWIPQSESALFASANGS
jgi:hypothetical protein